MTAFSLQEFARLFSEHMLNGMAAGIVVALFAWMLLRLMGRPNSSTRFAVWFAALLAIVALTFAGRLSPDASGLHSASANATIALPASAATYLFLGWSILAGIGILRLGIGVWKLRKLRAQAVAVDESVLDSVLRQTLRDFRSPRKVTLCVSEQQTVPAAIGYFKPMIVLPAWAMRELSSAELNAILIHELAHLRRWDDWTNLVQKVLRALFFFHPAVWWVERRLGLEREMACDDIVLSRTNPREYAECLVTLAKKSFVRRSLALVQAAIGQMRQTSRRVAQILDAERPGATRIWKPALGLVGTFVVICEVSQSRAPALFAFRENRPEAVAVASIEKEPALQNLALQPEPAAYVATSKKISRPKPVLAVHPFLSNRDARSRPVDLTTQAKLNGLPEIPAIQAKAVTASQNSGAAQTVLVVFQSQQNMVSGQVQWRVWIWRVTVQKALETSTVSKRT